MKPARSQDSGQNVHQDIKIWSSKELFQNRREIFIEHEQAIYRLIITKSGKLILNK